MALKKNLILLIIIAISLIGYGDAILRQYLSKANSHLKEFKRTFGNDYLKSDLLSHFPEKIKDSTSLRMSIAPPSCPPSYKCSAQFGDVLLICKRDTVIENQFKINCLSQTSYSNDSLMIINLTELRRDIYPIEKCNIAYMNKHPIPYFEDYDFGMGDKKVKTFVEGDKIPYYIHIHTVPRDLIVYVAAAEAGDFWKENCNENRPESLKDWKHGYSKGIAVSEEKDILVYWTMVW